METPVELRRQAAPRNADVPASLTIDWPALDQADIDATREETSSQALVTGPAPAHAVWIPRGSPRRPALDG